MNYQDLKYKIFKIISVDNENYLPSKMFDILIIILIILSVFSIISSTFTNIPYFITQFNYYFEYISIAIFTIEYLLRIWTANLLFQDETPLMSRVKYIFSFMAIIDLLAILPFYIPFIIKVDLRSLRMLRLIRMLRIFKLNRYTNALSSVVNVLKKKKDQLLASMFVVILLMLISSILMYYCENEAQPDVFDNAFSGLWWAIATLTTVGYGDIYPVTILGKIISAFLALLGIGLVAVPTGIISAGFSEEVNTNNQEKEEDYNIIYCPHCGRKIKK